MPEMPDTEHPKMNAWVRKLSESVAIPDKECYFIGHSLGCITILRYLETIKEKVACVVLVAGFADDLGIQEVNSFFLKEIDWNKIRANCQRFVAINSDNDPYVPLSHAEIFKENLKAEVIIKHAGHFSASDGITVLPAVLNALD